MPRSCRLPEATLRVAGAADSGTPLIVVLDGIEDPHNVGAILRTVDAAGATGVVRQSRRAAPLDGAAAKASAGAVHHVAVADVVNIARAVEELKEAGVWTVGLDADAETTYYELDLTVPTALVLGAEGHGLRRLVRERCDFVAAIPMAGHVGSLNVSAAAAVVLFEAVRQRRRRRSPCGQGFWRLGLMGFPRSASTARRGETPGEAGFTSPPPGLQQPGGPNAVDPGGGPFLYG